MVAELPLIDAEAIEVGMVLVGQAKRDPIRKVGSITKGRKWITVMDESGQGFGHWQYGQMAKVAK